MKKHIIYLLSFIGFLFAQVESVYAKDDSIPVPTPNLLPYEVVRIQLNALKNEIRNGNQVGIYKTWEFAHPDNKSFTGPFSLFSKMITDTDYSILLNHQSHKITLRTKKYDREIYEVEVLCKKLRQYSMVWVVSIVKSGKFKDCWMTSNVSIPLLIGNIM